MLFIHSTRSNQLRSIRRLNLQKVYKRDTYSLFHLIRCLLRGDFSVYIINVLIYKLIRNNAAYAYIKFVKFSHLFGKNRNVQKNKQMVVERCRTA